MKKAIALILALMLVVTLTGCNSSKYKKAVALYEEGNYQEAAQIFLEIGDYKDSQEKAKMSLYSQAAALFEAENYEEALAVFEQISGYENSDDMIHACKYGMAEQKFNAGEFDAALALFEEIPDYNNSAEMISQCKLSAAKVRFEEQDYDGAAALLEGMDSAEANTLRFEIKTAVMLRDYADVVEALDGNFWYYNGGSDVLLNRLSFSGLEAELAQMELTGNGRRDCGSNTFAYLVDDSSILIDTGNGVMTTIPYNMENGVLSLREGGYLTEAEVDADLQGYWTLDKKDTIALLNMTTHTKYNLHMENGKITYENAALAYGGRNGEYYYYGPYSGTYTLGFGSIKHNAQSGITGWHFNIIDGKAVPLQYMAPCSRGTMLPGKNGYSF